MAIKGNMKKAFIVYLVTNLVNGKRYVGITGQRTLDVRIRQHFYHALAGRGNGSFYRAIRKYGKSAFVWSVLKKCEDGHEAIAEEIRFISEMKPEYNSTKGGDGHLGYQWTDEARRFISNLHRGNKYHLGKPHNEETKKRLREYGIRDKEKWKLRSGSGPKASSKEIICLDDGKIFESMSAAARFYKVSTGALSELCRGKKYRVSIAGKHFSYVRNVGQRMFA